MTLPLDSQAFPQTPTTPSAAPSGYVTPVTPASPKNEPPVSPEKVASMRANFIELILRQVVSAIFGIFSPGGGSAFSQLATWASNVPFIGGTIGSAISFIQGFLDPAKLLVSQTRLDNPPQSGFPLAFPVSFGELAATPIQLLTQNLSRFLGGSATGGNLISAAFTLPTAALSFIQNALMPQNAIAALDPVTGLVPDAQKPQAVQDIVDHANNAYAGNPLGAVAGFGIGTVFDIIGGIFHAGTNAQAVNVLQNAQLDALTSSGTGISEPFDGAAASDLGPNFVQSYYGSGSGTCGVDGNGYAVWNVSGAGIYGSVNRHVTTLTTDTQKVSLILANNVPNTTNSPVIKIQARMNATADECIEARISYNSCEIGYVLGGTYVRIGSATGLSGDTNGVWDLKVGTVADSRQFLLYRNGALLVDETDGGGSSSMGASNRYVAWSHQAGNNFFWVFYQVAGPNVDSFSASDRTPTS